MYVEKWVIIFPVLLQVSGLHFPEYSSWMSVHANIFQFLKIIFPVSEDHPFTHSQNNEVSKIFPS